MPRGSKKINIDREITQIDFMLKRLYERTDALETRRSALLSMKQNEEIMKISEAIDREGLTTDAVRELIEKASNNQS